MPRCSRFGAAVALCGALLGLETARSQVILPPDVIPIPRCRLIPNGGFTQGFASWTTTPTTASYGIGGSFTSATIQDLTGSGGDANAACLSAGAFAEWTCDFPSGSSAMAQVELTTTATVSGRYLRYCFAAGFEAIIFGKGRACYDAVLIVKSTSTDAVVKCPIVDNCFNPDLPCDGGISILGGYPYNCRCCDLAAGGIAIGDIVEITFLVSTAVTASNECDIADFGGTWCVDHFQFCNYCPVIIDPELLAIEIARSTVGAEQRPTGATPDARLEKTLRHTRELAFSELVSLVLPGDVDANGAVDARDLRLLKTLIEQGANDMPDADVNRDGLLDLLDLAELSRLVK